MPFVRPEKPGGLRSPVDHSTRKLNSAGHPWRTFYAAEHPTERTMIHAEGPLLSVDVGARTATEVDVDDVLESYIGGRGVGTKLAHDRIPFDADPLGPDNSLVFAVGPFQTTIMSYTGRMSCTGLSPLTDGLLSSNAGAT